MENKFSNGETERLRNPHYHARSIIQRLCVPNLRGVVCRGDVHPMDGDRVQVLNSHL